MLRKNVELEDRVLILAPTGGDAANATLVLNRAGFKSETCSDLAQLCLKAREGAGAMLISEEALLGKMLPCLVELLKNQPSWSDIPIIAITSGGEATHASIRVFDIFGPSGNITLMERPFRAITLISALHVALRARHRQYQVRDLMGNLEQRVAERTAKLEETVSEMEAFSYSISHDLRAPLRAMQGYSYFLLEDYGDKLDDTGKDYLARIISSGNRLDRLVQDILTYSRFARSELELRPVNLENLVLEIVQHYPALQPPMAKIKIKTPLVMVMGHDGSLTQCVSNLLSNAVKFVPAGKVPEVNIWTDDIGPDVRVWFRDNGIGIEPAHQNRIFKMFERAPHANNYDGTGIGLAIVHKAVERMGGKVGVESEPGRGSKFWIQLPKG